MEEFESYFKEGHIVKVDAGTYWYNDPYTLDFMRKDLKEKLIKAAELIQLYKLVK